jgi:hypothetical protein
MRRGAWILLISLTLSLSEVLALEPKDEARLIRRAYLDVLGVVPTIDELEWYMVYNTDGYSRAIDWLLTSSPMRLAGMEDIARKRSELLSSKYMQALAVPIGRKKQEEVIYYLAGYIGERSPEALKKAKKDFIAFARVYEDGDLEAIDRMCLGLMGRVTNLDEANRLLRILGCGIDALGEEEGWLNVLEQILELEDAKSK